MLSEVKSVSGTWPRETGKGKHHALEKLALALEGAEMSEVRGTNFLQCETTLETGRLYLGLQKQQNQESSQEEGM